MTPRLDLGRRVAAGALVAVAAAGAQAQSQAPAASFPLPPKDWPSPVMDRRVVPFLLLDRLEYRAQNGRDAQVWDGQAYVGTDYDKLWLKFEGDKQVGGRTERADIQALYARLISPFWHLQIGARRDERPGPARNYGVLAIQGLAPFWFNVEASLFARGGEVAGRLEAEYDLRATQRWVLQPRIETNLSSASDRARGLGGGFRDVELGLRMRYEIRREIAPYIGVTWSRQLGSTATMARQAGEAVSSRAVVAGIRLWY